MGVKDNRVTSGDISPCLSLTRLRPGSGADENGGGGSGNINGDDYQNVSQRNGNEGSEISRDSTM